MKIFSTLFAIAPLLLFFNPDLSAQCSGITCTTPVPAVNAQNACILPSPQALNCYYGATTPDLPQSFPPSWCTDINNNHWFAFTATSTLAFFTFNVFNCTGGPGIQVAVLSTADCITFQTVAACTGITTATSYTLVVPGLMPGQVYYLCIDGTEGALCGYSINGQNPSINAIGNPYLCVSTSPTSSYATNNQSNWTINPPGAGTILGNPMSDFITVEWLQPGPAQVCAQSIACPGAPQQCVDVFVHGSQTEEHVNLCEGKTVTCAGETFSTPGIHDVVFDTGNNCDSTVKCLVHLVPIVNTTENHVACAGDSVQCAGQYFSTAGNFPVTLQTPQGCDSIVHCAIAIMPVDTAPVQVVNLCAPSTYQICGTTYTNSGVYTKTCTGALGCDSIVTVDLAILQPKVTIAPPGVLGCDPNATLTLSLNSWTQNTAAGGATLFQWTGPGIVGPGDQTSVQVNQPGEYCFILTHGRGGLFCADTACVTLTSVGSVPPVPLISGNPNPCANTSDIYTAVASGSPLPVSFVWTTPGNVPFVVLSPDSIAVQWPDTAVSGQICVTANDSCGASPAACIAVNIQPGHYMQSAQICPGETLLLGGGLQNISGVYTDTLPSINGCDSIIVTTLTVNAVDTVTYFLNTCDPAAAGTVIESLNQANGCDSIIITTTSLWPSDSILISGTSCNVSDTGVFVQHLSNLYGCDSTVITTITFLMADTTLLNASSCDPAATGVFTQHFVTTAGCDSLVITTVSLLPGDTTLLNDASCNPADAGTFTQNLVNQYGCDSIIITTVTLLPSDTTLLNGTSCAAGSAGVFTQSLVNQYGCDSTVLTTITYIPLDTTQLSGTTCDPNAAGVFSQTLVTAPGCDSVIVTTISLLPVNQTIIQSTTCDTAAAGVFTQHLLNQYGCDSTVTETVTLLPLAACSINAVFSGSNVLCGETTGSLNVTATQGEAPFDYSVFSGTIPVAGGTITGLNVPQVLNGFTPGTYTLQISSANGLSMTAVATVTQSSSPSLEAVVTSEYNGFNISCSGETDGSAQASAIGGALPFVFTWSDGNTGALAAHMSAGIYTVTLTDAQGCTDTAQVTLTEPSALGFSFVVNDLDCFGQHDGAILVAAQGGVAPWRYALGSGAFQSADTFHNLDAGAYTVTMLDANDCQQTETILVNAALPVLVDLGENQTIEVGGSTVLQAIVNVPADSILSVAWTPPFDSSECPDCLSQVVAPFVSTTYSVEITTLDGCSGADRTTVVVDRRRYLYVPTVFSPNGDGNNDLFGIFVPPGTVRRIKSFQVFDRWGEMVYASGAFAPDDPHVGWDGRLNSRYMNPGVFVWTVEVEFVDGVAEIFRGDVTLVR